jgi:hypothetical protein
LEAITTIKTWKPTVTGILNIVVGALGLVSVVGILIALLFVYTYTEVDLVTVILIVCAVYSGVLGVLSLVGGIYALQRQKWGLAFVGSIAAVLLITPIGVLSIIFISLSQDEFM